MAEGYGLIFECGNLRLLADNIQALNSAIPAHVDTVEEVFKAMCPKLASQIHYVTMPGEDNLNRAKLRSGYRQYIIHFKWGASETLPQLETVWVRQATFEDYVQRAAHE